jgi:predicted acylesterase/phospholipase RssA
MSSAAIPGVFPWVDGVWDGAFHQHNPLKPAVVMGATEILVVHLDVPKTEISLPKGILQTAWRIIELSSSNNLIRDVKLLRERNTSPGYREIDVNVVCPQKPLGYSKLNFDDGPMKTKAIDLGYNTTMNLLGT